MARLSVVQVLPALNGGGVERGTLEVAHALVQAGHRSIVISAGGRMVPQLLDEGSEHLEWPIGEKSLMTLRWISRLRSWLAEQHVNIVHARSRLPAWISWLAWRGMEPFTRPRFITTVHGLYSCSPYSAIMTRGERVIAVSETVRTYLQHHYPTLPNAQIVTIPRGVDPAEFPYGYRPSDTWFADWYQQYPQLQGAMTLTLPGRLSRLKGHETFIQLITQLRAEGCNVRGLIVGGVEPRRQRYAAQLEQQVRSLGLQEAVVFTGHRSDMREIYAASTIVFSLSTQPESFGRTVLEALSLGVPVIGTDHGGVGEVLRQLCPEGCVVPGDVSLLAARVQQFLATPPIIPDYQPYTLRAMLAKTLDVYRTLALA